MSGEAIKINDHNPTLNLGAGALKATLSSAESKDDKPNVRLNDWLKADIPIKEKDNDTTISETLPESYWAAWKNPYGKLNLLNADEIKNRCKRFKECVEGLDKGTQEFFVMLPNNLRAIYDSLYVSGIHADNHESIIKQTMLRTQHKITGYDWYPYNYDEDERLYYSKISSRLGIGRLAKDLKKYDSKNEAVTQADEYLGEWRELAKKRWEGSLGGEEKAAEKFDNNVAKLDERTRLYLATLPNNVFDVLDDGKKDSVTRKVADRYSDDLRDDIICGIMRDSFMPHGNGRRDDFLYLDDGGILHFFDGGKVKARERKESPKIENPTPAGEENETVSETTPAINLVYTENYRRNLELLGERERDYLLYFGENLPTLIGDDEKLCSEILEKITRSICEEKYLTAYLGKLGHFWIGEAAARSRHNDGEGGVFEKMQDFLTMNYDPHEKIKLTGDKKHDQLYSLDPRTVSYLKGLLQSVFDILGEDDSILDPPIQHSPEVEGLAKAFETKVLKRIEDGQFRQSYLTTYGKLFVGESAKIARQQCNEPWEPVFYTESDTQPAPEKTSEEPRDDFSDMVDW